MNSFSKVSVLFISLGASFAMGGGSHSGKQIVNVNPFSLQTSVGDDASDAKVEEVKLDKVATKLSVDYSGCLGVSQSEPGGSDFCPQVKVVTAEPAYVVTVSYETRSGGVDQPGPSRSSSFFYVKPDEFKSLPPAKAKGTKAGTYIIAKLRSASEEVRVLDPANSKQCEYKLDDGGFSQADPNCVENLVYRTEQRESLKLEIQPK